MWHHSGGQTSSTDGAQAGGGTTARRLTEPSNKLWFLCDHLLTQSVFLQIDSEVCSQRILISNLPNMDTDTLLNKLEIHFSKKKNGGGEVDECEMLPDSGTVVLTFVDNNGGQIITQLFN